PYRPASHPKVYRLESRSLAVVRATLRFYRWHTRSSRRAVSAKSARRSRDQCRRRADELPSSHLITVKGRRVWNRRGPEFVTINRHGSLSLGRTHHTTKQHQPQRAVQVLRRPVHLEFDPSSGRQ